MIQMRAYRNLILKNDFRVIIINWLSKHYFQSLKVNQFNFIKKNHQNIVITQKEWFKKIVII